MACFTVSTIGALGVCALRHVVKRKEKTKKHEVKKFGSDVLWSKKLSYLEIMLFSGSLLLLIEHIIHGEIVFYPPFITAMQNKEDTIKMLYEIGTVGVLMFLIILVAWALGVFVYDMILYKKRMSKMILEGK